MTIRPAAKGCFWPRAGQRVFRPKCRFRGGVSSAGGAVEPPARHAEVAVLAVARGEQYLDARLWGTGSPKPLADAFPLTDREVAVLRRSALGDSNGDVAAGLDIAVKTVDGHKSNAMKKLGLRSRADLIRYAFLHGWLDDV